MRVTVKLGIALPSVRADALRGVRPDRAQQHSGATRGELRVCGSVAESRCYRCRQPPTPSPDSAGSCSRLGVGKLSPGDINGRLPARGVGGRERENRWRANTRAPPHTRSSGGTPCYGAREPARSGARIAVVPSRRVVNETWRYVVPDSRRLNPVPSRPISSQSVLFRLLPPSAGPPAHTVHITPSPSIGRRRRIRPGGAPRSARSGPPTLA